MAKSVVLHIGTTKTGTTSIQHSLAAAQRNGDLGPVCYPLWENDNNQQRLAVLYLHIAELDLFPSLRERFPAAAGDFAAMRERYRDFLSRELGSADKAIISAEMLSHLFTPQRAALLRDDLVRSGFQDFRVILYIRDPADHYLSNANQSLRMSDDPPLIKDPATYRYDFLRVTQTWEEAFPGRLVVRGYDPHVDVVEDFSGLIEQYLGLSIPRGPMRKNSTLSSEGMQILQDYRQLFQRDNCGDITPDARRLARFLEESWSACDLSQTVPELKTDVAQQIRSNHRADAELLKSQYGVDLGVLNWGEASSTARHEPYRVDELVQSVDPSVVHQLLLRFARAEAVRPLAKQSLPIRVSARMYRRIPTPLRPVGLAARLKKRLSGSQ